jgi:hypothetical protein
MGGGDEKGFNDKKVDNLFRAQFEKNYRGFLPQFKDAEIDLSGLTPGTDAYREQEMKKINAQSYIKARFEDGSWSPKDLDSRTLQKSAPYIAEGMKLGTIKALVKTMTDAQKTNIKDAFRNVDTYKSREILAHIDNARVFEGRDNERRDFLGSLSLDQIKEILSGSNDQKAGLREIVTSIEDFNSEVQASFGNSENRIAQSIRREFNF